MQCRTKKKKRLQHKYQTMYKLTKPFKERDVNHRHNIFLNYIMDCNY